MSAVTKFFFRSPYPSQTTWAIIRWWEGRRLAYNLAVGGAGVASLALVALIEVFPPGPGRFAIPLVPIIAYGVLANLMYSLGPLVDSLICHRWGEKYSAVGPTLFRYGFVFAVGVSLLPVPVALLAWGFRLLGSLF